MALLRFLLFGILLASACPARAQGSPPFAVPERWVRNRTLIAGFDSLEAHGRGPAAWGFLDSLAAAARARGDQVLLMQVLVRRGGTRTFRGDLARGEPDLIEANALAVSLRDTLGMLESTRWRASGYSSRENFTAARPLWTQMQKLARAWGSASHEGWALLGLAYADLHDVHRERARLQYRGAIAKFKSCGDRVGLHQAWIGLARMLSTQGRYPEVLQLYREQLADARASNDRYGAAQVLNNLGSAEYQSGDPAEAISLWQQSAEAQRKLGMPSAAEGGPELNLGLALTRLRRYDEAARRLENVSADAWRVRNYASWMTARTHLATCRLAQRRADEALRILDAAVPVADSVAFTTRAWMLYERARLLYFVQRPEDALAQLRVLKRDPALTQHADLFSSVLSLQAALLLLQSKPRDALLTILEGERAMNGAGAPQESAEMSRMRGQAYTGLGQPDSALVAFRRAIDLGAAMKSRTSSLEWREEMTIHAVGPTFDYARALLAAPSAGTPAQRQRAAFEFLQRQTAATLLERVRGPGASEAQAAPAFTLARLQRSVLRDGELLLDLHEDVSGGLMFAVTRTAMRVLPMAATPVSTPRLARFYDVLMGDDRDAGREGARALAKVYFEPIGDLLRASHRVIVSGDARTVPFAVLPFANDAPLAATHEIAYTPSAALLAELRARVPRTAAKPIYALAGEADTDGRRLTGALDEVRWLARTFPNVQLRLPDPARRAAQVAAEMGTCEVLHLAGHAEADENLPWASGLLVGRDGQPDAWLRAAEITRHRLTARLAVLSGCRSVGVGEPGEGIIGLSTAFLVAGCATTISTLWPVEDAAANAFVKEFYLALTAGRTASGALRQAQAALRAAPATSAPSQWAAFVLVGEPSTRVTFARAGASPPRPVTGTAPRTVTR